MNKANEIGRQGEAIALHFLALLVLLVVKKKLWIWLLLVKSIDKIVVFYSDNSFEEYKPNK